MYDIRRTQWTWLSGNDSGNALGNYGIKGITSTNNYPGSRNLHAMVLNPVLNCTYIYGGTSDHGTFNDLWMYNISSNLWTWMSGNSTADAAGVYGTKGIPSIDTYPGARNSHAMTLDPGCNCLIMFGGYGYHSSLGSMRNIWS